MSDLRGLRIAAIGGLRTYKGRLVKEKPEAERKLIAARIKEMDLDVIAVQKVEDINTLRRFVRDDLGGLFSHSILIEGNDPSSSTLGCCPSVRLAALPKLKEAFIGRRSKLGGDGSDHDPLGRPQHLK